MNPVIGAAHSALRRCWHATPWCAAVNAKKLTRYCRAVLIAWKERRLIRQRFSGPSKADDFD